MRKFVRNLGRKAWLARQYVRSALFAGRHARDFDAVETFCMFVGYPRSGHSLVGSLIDAHRHAIIAHELNALKCRRYGFSRRQIYFMLRENSQVFTEHKGRSYSGYSYRVPNQWQGRYEKLRVIGDKFGDRSIEAIMTWPWALDKLQATIGIPMKFVHVIRNPFDNISTIRKKTGRARRDMDQSIDWYFSLVEGCHQLRERHGEAVIDFYLEKMIADPKAELGRLTAFLGLDAPDDYLADCASIVFDKPRKTQRDAEWTPDHVKRVREWMQRYDFLANAGYEPDAM